MKYLGIDYGAKNIGVALSEEESNLAFPHSVIANDKRALEKIEILAKENGIVDVVVGESKNFSMKENPIMGDIKRFVFNLKSRGFRTYFEPEYLTSHQAKKIQGDNDKIDASAAAIILQSFLDKKGND